MLLEFVSKVTHETEQAFAKLAEVTAQLCQCSDTAELLQTSVQQTRGLFGSDRVVICQAFGDDPGLIVAESLTTDWDSLLYQMLPLALLSLEATDPSPETGSVAVDQVQNGLVSAAAIATLTRWQVQAYLASPIWINAPPSAVDSAPSQLWGWIMVHQCRPPSAWHPIHRQVLQQIATQLGATLERLQLQEQMAALQTQAATAIKQSEAKYQLATRACAIGVWDWDLQTNDIYLDPLLKEMLGYRDDEIRNHIDDWAQYVYAEDLPQVMAAATEHLEGRSPEYRVEHRMVHRDGSLRWVLAQGTALRSPDGTPYRLVGTDIDITDRKTAELALAEQSRQERAFNDVVQAVRSSLNVDTVFVEAAASISAFLEGEVSIVQYLPTENCWRHQVIYDRGTRQIAEQYVDVPDADNPFADRLKQLEIIQIDNTAKIQDPVNRRLAQTTSYRAWLMVPISREGTVWGSLTLARSEQLQPWTANAVQLAERVAEQLAIAIHQANLYQQLQAAHERDKLVLQSIGEGVWDWDPNEDVIHNSDRYWEILGYAPQTQGLSRFSRELKRIPPDERDLVRDTVYQHLSTREPFTIECRMQHQQGHDLWIRARGQAVWNDQGQPIRMLGTIEDISDRKQAELDLQASEAFRRQVMELAPIPLYIYDLELAQLTYCNRAYEASLGYTLAELQAMGEAFLPALYHPDYYEQLAAHDQEIRADREGRVYEMEYTCTRKDGSSLMAFSREVVLSRQADGTPKAVLGFGLDLTERKAMESALRESQALYQSLAEAMPQCLYRKDRQQRFTYANPAMLNWLQVTEAELIGKTTYDVFSPEAAAQYDAEDRQVLATGEIFDIIDGPQQIGSGPPCYVQVVKSQVRDGEGTIVGTQGIFWDVTTHCLLEQELQESRDQLAMILNSLHAAVGKSRLLDETSNFVYDYLSPGTEIVFGYSPDELLADPHLWQSRIAPHDWATVVEPAIQELLQGLPYKTIEYRFRLPDGASRWIQETISAARETGQDCWSFTIVATDISDRKQAELDLERTRKQREEEFRTLAENSPDGIARVDTALRLQYVNPIVEKLLAMPRTELLGKHITDLSLSAESLAQWQTAITAALKSGQEQQLEPHETYPSGTYAFQSRVVPERNAQGDIASVLVVSRDITSLKQAETALWRRVNQEHSLLMITQHIRESLDLSSILSTAVNEVQQMLGADRTVVFQLLSDCEGIVIEEAVRPEYPSILGRRWEEKCFPRLFEQFYRRGQGRIIMAIPQDDRRTCLMALMQSISVQSKMVAPITQRLENNTVRVWGLFMAQACATDRQWQSEELDLLQQVANQLAIALQQSELHQQLLAANRELEHLSSTDGLTKIANRRRFDATLITELQRAHRDERKLALILGDIDHFKQYNDTYGHPAGDQCLVTVAQALQSCVNRATDCVARYGGEEFAIILPDTDLAGAIVIVQNMQTAIATCNIAHRAHPTSDRVTLSFGLTVALPQPQPDVTALVKQADLALYQAKQNGRDRYQISE